MFTLNGVTLRPLEVTDQEVMYAWHLDYELDIYSAWGRAVSRAAFGQWLEKQVLGPRDDMVRFGIVTEERLVGDIQLAQIDTANRHASVGVVIGERSVWGRGVGKTAVRILLDYAFMVKNLDKVYAEVYAFNARSRRLMESVGFRLEGILREHEVHNGTRHDMYFYGMLKPEFYERYETLFRLPDIVEEE